MSVSRLVRVLCGLAALAGVCVGAEVAYLRNGQMLFIDRHEDAGEIVRLFQEGGRIEAPASSVERFEQILDPENPVVATEGTAAAEAPSNLIEEPVSEPSLLLKEAAARHGLPENFVLSVALAESKLNQRAISHKGAVGIMQLMPGTAAALNADPYDVAQNIDAGVRYLRDLLVRYQNHPDQVHRALAAYNAGPGAVQRYGGVPPYPETVSYVRRVVNKYLATPAR